MARIVPTTAKPERKAPPFAAACRKYVHRFTMEHVPARAKVRREDGTYYAPHYASDGEWYDRTRFPGEAGHIGHAHDCYSTGQAWPLGQVLHEPYRKA